MRYDNIRKIFSNLSWRKFIWQFHMQTVGISKLSGYKILNPCNLCYNFALYLLHASVLRREAVEIRNRRVFIRKERKSELWWTMKVKEGFISSRALSASENKKYKTSQWKIYYKNSNLTHLKYYSIFLAEINFIWFQYCFDTE